MKSPLASLLGTNIVSRNMLAPGDGLLGAIAVKMMTRGNRLTSEDAAARLGSTPDLCVLELGPGSGWGLRALASGHPKRLVGVEISARFRQELAALSFPVNLEIHGESALDMSGFLDAGSVDRLLAVNVVYFLNPLADYAAELFRVMGPGSRGLLACNPALIQSGHDDVFVNKDLKGISETFEKSGFAVAQEDVDLRYPPASYTAVHLAK